MSIILSDLVKEIDVLQRLVNKIKKRDCELDVDCYWLTKKLQYVKQELITISNNTKDRPELNINDRVQLIKRKIRKLEDDIFNLFSSKL